MHAAIALTPTILPAAVLTPLSRAPTASSSWASDFPSVVHLEALNQTDQPDQIKEARSTVPVFIVGTSARFNPGERGPPLPSEERPRQEDFPMGSRGTQIGNPGSYLTCRIWADDAFNFLVEVTSCGGVAAGEKTQLSGP